jgi:hypothetical protein
MINYLRGKWAEGCMRTLVFAVVFLLYVTGAAAEVDVRVDKDAYNLGDWISSSYVLSTNEDFNGLVRLSLRCDQFSLDFYALPTNLYAGQSQSVSVPGLAATHRMVGSCSVSAEASSFDSGSGFSGSSGRFEVSNEMSLIATLNQELFNPGDKVFVAGAVGKSHSLPASATLSFLDKNYPATVFNNSFSYAVVLPLDIASGRHRVSIVVNDSHGNKGRVELPMSVEAVPTSLHVILSSNTPLPGDFLQVNVSLLDQAGITMRKTAQIALKDPFGSVLFAQASPTPAKVDIQVSKTLAPGAYTLEVLAAGKRKDALMVVEPFESVNAFVENGKAIISNDGNIQYSRTLLINLTGAKKFLLSQDLSLAPNETVVIDLSREVPEGGYNISFPTLEQAPGYEQSHIDDGRTAAKKTTDFLGITGRVTDSGGSPSGVTRMFSSLIILILLALFVRTARRSDRWKAAVSRFGRKRETSAASPPPTAPVPDGKPEELSRDDETVKNWLKNLEGDKPFK